MSPGLLTLHLICACLCIGASTHQALFAWRRPARAARFASLALVTGLVAAVLGAVIYPDYKTDLRGPWLETALPDGVRAFDLKEHLVALSLATHWGAWVLARGGRATTARGPSRTAYVSLATLSALLVWIGGLIGVYMVSWQATHR
ncbi:MAG: hypothetical protein ACE366_26390 [Bradymonadia bacterium]